MGDRAAQAQTSHGAWVALFGSGIDDQTLAAGSSSAIVPSTPFSHVLHMMPHDGLTSFLEGEPGAQGVEVAGMGVSTR